MNTRGLGSFISAELTAGRKPRLLIIDDQPLMVQALYQVFAQDCQVFMGTRGEQALSLCRAHRPDLVLLGRGDARQWVATRPASS